MTTPLTPLSERFWAMVNKREGDGCWEWTGSWDHRKGYGQIRVNGKTRRAPRVGWEMTHGPVPDGLHVLHRCDNPRCVRLDHLFLGTNRDNVRDSVAKGRHHQAAKTHCAQGHALTPENVILDTHRGWTERKCRECDRARKAAKKAAA